jgi:hypothetical protein
MKRKVLMVFSLLLILSLGLVPAADAQGTVGPGHGELSAKGIGYAELHGGGEVNILGHGAGMFWIKGAEELRAQGQGRRWELPDGTVILAGWRGHIRVEGKELAIRMLGGTIQFTAEGTGWAFLKGRGRYQLDGQSGQWTREGIRVEFPPAAETE